MATSNPLSLTRTSIRLTLSILAVTLAAASPSPRAEVETLLTEKQLGPLQGFRSRMGKPFAAVLKMNAEFRIEFDFGEDKKGENANTGDDDEDDE